jgi:predicted HTH transcriptional regulator
MVFRSVGESDDVSAANKILEFIEKRGITTKSEIMKVLWRHVARDQASRILEAFVEGKIIQESSQGNAIIYKYIVPSTGGTP